MRQITKSALLALAASALTISLQAQDGGPRRGGGEGMPPRMHPLMAVLDANHDGVIDETEIAAAPAALKKLDKDSDGKIALAELRPTPPEGSDAAGEHRGPRRSEGRPDGASDASGAPDRALRGGPNGPRPGAIPPFFAALDANHDGSIDETELSNTVTALKALDKDADGKLSADELRPARPEGEQGRSRRGREDRPPQDGQ